MERKHKGACSELVALIWLFKEGYEVFRNVSQHGCCDLIATRGEEILKVDVKTASSLNNSYPTKEQRDAGVCLLMVDLEKEKVLGWASSNDVKEVVCKVCGKHEMHAQGAGWETMCSEDCRQTWYRQYHKERYKRVT